MGNFVSLNGRSRSLIYRSFLLSLCALIVGAAVVGFTASAANYSPITSGSVNWTATTSGGGSAVWSCTPTATNDICGIYPGQNTTNPFVDNASVATGSALTIAVTSSIPAPVTVNLSGFGDVVDVGTGGALTLSGNSQVTSTGGSAAVSVSGGTLAFVGSANLTINGLSTGAQFNFNGGTLSGAGSITGSQSGVMNITGTQGPMSIGNGVTVTNNSTLNYNSTLNGLTLNGSISNAATGTFGANGTAAIAGSGAIGNSGSFQKASGGPLSINTTFNNGGTVALASTALTLSFLGGGGSTNSTWNLGPGGTINFGGLHTFGGTQSFAGTGALNINTTGTWGPNTAMSIPAGINVTNNGAIDFAGSGAFQTLSIAGNYNQSGTGLLKEKIGGPPAGSSDKLNVTGTSTLAGNYTAIFGTPYTPANGETFTVFTTGTRTGDFASKSVPVVPNKVLVPQYTAGAPTSLQLVAVPTVDIAVSKAGPASVLHNATATYTVMVSNVSSPNSATAVTISDSFNSGTFNTVSSSPGCTLVSPGNITCTVGTVAPGASVNLTIAIDATSLTTITNTASLGTLNEIDTNAANNSSTVTTTVTPVADIALTKAGPATVVAGAPLSYTLNVNNLGPDNAGTVTITDAVPAGVTGITATGTGWTCSVVGNNVTCTQSALPPGPASAITINSTAPVAGGSITNTASATTSGSSDPVPSNNTSTPVTTTVTASSDVGITKTGPVSAVAGQTVIYTIVVSNAGPSAATGVSVTDTPGAGLTFVSNSGACTTAFPCSLGTIASGSSVTITSTYSAASNLTGSLTNTATVTSTTPDPALGNNTATAVVPVTTSADLSITKSLTSTLTAGTNATYSIVVMNNGPSDATGVTVTDPTPAGMTFVSNTGACTTAFPCSIGTLTAGSNATITTTFAVASTATGSISNTATVSATTPDPSPGNNSSTATGTIGTNADLQITKSGPATANPGQTYTFLVTVVNNGPSAATGVAVQDTTPAGMTFVSNTGACTTAYPCTIGSLGAGASASITSTYTISPSATGTIANTATVTSTSTDPNPANNSATASVAINPSSDLSIVKSGPANAFPGQTITYTVMVTNNGPSPSTVTVSDVTPAGLTFVSNSGACTTAYPCAVGSLAAGQSVTISSNYSVALTATGTVTNTASVSGTTPDPVAGNNSSSTTTTITQQADLSITKSGPATIPASGQITFNITVKNLGPSTASTVFVNDNPGPGLTFVANSGGCTTPFPCTFPSIANGATVTIQSTFKVSKGVAQVTNTADVNASAMPDPNLSNNSSSVTVGAGNTCPQGPLTQFTPFSGQQDVPAAGTMQWTNLGASNYEVYFGPAGTGCSTLVTTVNGTSYNYTGLTPNTDYESRIVAVEPSCPSIASQCIRWKTAATGGCNLTAPQLVSPLPGTTVGGSTTLKWNAVTGATSYHVVVIVNGTTQVDTTTGNTSLDVTIPNGNTTWSVSASNGNCTGPTSTGTFNSCGAPPAPIAGVVGAPSSGNTYSVIVTQPSSTAVSYEYQEATNASFDNVTTTSTSATSVQYTHTTNVPQEFFYRVRAIGGCGNAASLFSKTIRVVIVPNLVNLRNPNLNVPAGNKGLVTIQVQVPGDSVKENFAATADRPWIVRIDPSSGILPPEGIVLNVTIDPAQLPNGTFTATVIVSTSPINSGSRIVTNGNAKSVPVSINLVTPVIPVNPDAPTADSIFIPAVGHLAGLNSQWRSDIRIYNASPQTLQYLLNFTPQGSTEVKRTTITTASGDTTALDDVIHNWFGVGEIGDSSTGVLEIRPMTTDGSTKPPQGSAFTTVASSRTFDSKGDGTVGQFIPPVKFTNFIGNGSRLSMQQLAQSTAYRTNFGLLEGSGAPVSLVLSMFNSDGSKLFDLPVNLAAGEQKLLNGLLVQQGVTSLSDGRMEVKVAGGDGKVTAYASVIDNASLDPQLVPGQTLTNTSSKLYVVPGVADLNNGVAAWRTDMRVYNSGSTPATTDVVFYPQNNGQPFFATLTVNPGEVKVLDNILQSLFATHDVGGMVQLTTSTDSQLVVTARTYNQTANGTLGQFIKAATAAEGITTSTKGLNILQVEDSPRFRTNLGIAEMTGKPATVEVSLILPDSKVTPSIQVPLAANEFRQFSVAQFGLGNIYNARVSVKVVDGAGSVTAYGSVIDQVTTDPTYVQAQ